MPLATNNMCPCDFPACIEQLSQQSTAHPLPHLPQCVFGRLQVHPRNLLPPYKNSVHHPAYFLLRFRAYLRCNFFFNASNSASSSISRTGRSSHIFSFTSTNSLVSPKNTR